MSSHLRGAEEQQLRSVIETLRKECGTGPRGSHKFRAIVKTVASQLRQLSDSPVRTSSDIGSIKEPMPADLRGLHARFPPVHFCLSICGLRVVSGHIERDPLVFTIARGRSVADLIEAFATADELASESSAWRSKARRSPDAAAGPSAGSRSPPAPSPESARTSTASGPLEVSERDVEAWFDLLVADEARLEAVGTPPPADGEGGVAAVMAWREKSAAAQSTLAFPAAMAQRFVALRLYTGEGRPADSAERKELTATSSLSLMTAALRAHAAATNGEPADSSFGEGGPGRVAVSLIGRLASESAGPTLFGDRLAALPLSLVQLERWGGDMRSHAPTAAALGALFLAVVLHGLSDLEYVIKPLRPISAGTDSPSVTKTGLNGSNEPVPSLVLLGHWLESAAGSKAADLGRLSTHHRALLVDGFKTGFNLLQAVQGEAAACAALPIVKFLQQHGSRASALFLDHYVVVLASALPEHYGGSGSGVSTGVLRSSCSSMDGYTYPLYAYFIDRLARLADTDMDSGGSGGGGPPPEIAVSQLYRDYQSYRLGLCINQPKQHPGLGKLVAQLAPIPGVSKFLQAEAVATAVGRTLQMTQAVTRSSGGPLIAAWSQAVACFGAETMRTLVVELNKSGLPAQQLQKPQASPLRGPAAGTKPEKVAQAASSPPSSSALSCAIILEFAPAALSAAAQGRQWGSEVPAILAAMGWLFAETRNWLQSQTSNESARDTQTPQQRHWQMAYSLNLHSFATREQPASASPLPSSASSAATFSWGGSRGWMAELTAIAAQKRRGDHVELSEERQRRSGAVISSLKQRLTPVEKGVGGLLQLEATQGVLLSMPPEQVMIQGTRGAVVSGEQQERVGGQPRQRSPSEIDLDGHGSPGRVGVGKKPRRSGGATTNSDADAATLSAERQHRSDLDRRVKQLEDELAETKAMLKMREQERDNYRSYNIKLLAHNTNLRTAVREAQQTVPDFADIKAEIESKSSDDVVQNGTADSHLSSNVDSDLGLSGTREKQADGIVRAHAAAELADSRDRASRIFMLYQESGLEVRDFLELTLSSIQPGGGGGGGR